jgi:hypothetical protein
MDSGPYCIAAQDAKVLVVGIDLWDWTWVACGKCQTMGGSTIEINGVMGLLAVAHFFASTLSYSHH